MTTRLEAMRGWRAGWGALSSPPPLPLPLPMPEGPSPAHLCQILSSDDPKPEGPLIPKPDQSKAVAPPVISSR